MYGLLFPRQISKFVTCDLNGILFDCEEQEKPEICTWCWPYPLMCHIYISICAKVGVTRGGKVGACTFWYSLQSGHIWPSWEAWYCISLALYLWFHALQPVTWCQIFSARSFLSVWILTHFQNQTFVLFFGMKVNSEIYWWGKIWNVFSCSKFILCATTTANHLLCALQ